MAESLMRKAQCPTGCQICKQSTETNWKCVDCNRLICDMCKKTHTNIPATENHELISTKSEFTRRNLKMNQQEVCTHHKKNLSLHCSTCDEFICVDCILENHNTHRFNKIESVKQYQEEILQTFLTEIKEERKKQTEKVTKYESMEQECIDEFSSKRALVTKRKKELIKWIKMWRQSTISQLDSGQQPYIQDLDAKMKATENFLSSSNNAVMTIQNWLKSDDNPTFEFENIEEIINQLKYPDLSQPRKWEISYKEGCINKKKQDHVIGRLQIRDKPTKKETTRKLVKAIASLKAETKGDLSLEEGDIIEVLNEDPHGDGWSMGRCNGKTGLYPRTFVVPVGGRR